MLHDNTPFLYISGIGHPKWLIPENINIVVGEYGQYVIRERGYIDIVGNMDIQLGAELIILEVI